MTRRFLAGEPQDRLVKNLNARNVRTSQGNLWTPTRLKELLIRERNCGRILYTDSATGVTSVVSRLPGEPIVTEEDFDRVQSMIAARRRGRPASPAYLCSGIAVCGMSDCGKPLHGRPRNNMKPYDDGSVRRQYWCGPYSSGGCGKIMVDQRGMDAAAEALAIEILADPRHADAIEATTRELESEAAKLDLAIAEAEGVAEALADRLGRGNITLSRFDIAVRPLDERIAKLKVQRAALGDTPSQLPPRASREHWQRRWTVADAEERRALLKMALRGRRLIVGPADKGSPAQRTDVTRRIRIE
jgi:hypothetical protein